MEFALIGVSKSYGERAVFKNLTLRFQEGASHCLMGPSGSGKTTALRLLMGLETPDEGRVQGMEDRRYSAVFQEPRLIARASVALNLRMVCETPPPPTILSEELAALGLAGEEKTLVSELSGGMRQRVSIARAMMIPFDILFMDEPFQGLDEDTKELVIRRLLEKSRGKTVIWVSHDERDARRMGSRILPFP